MPFLVIVVGASYAPARRATRVDPVRALRAEQGRIPSDFAGLYGVPVVVHVMTKSPICRQLRSRSLTAALIAISLSACEHVTAPQARDAIEKTEAQVLKGNFEAFDGPFRALIDESRMKAHAAGAGNFQDPRPRIPSGHLVVVRDGKDIDYIATVLERVYAPSPASRGRPLIRRTLMAWALDSSEEVLVIASEDSIATVSLPVPGRLNQVLPVRQYDRLAYVVRSPGRRHPTWFGNRGSVELRGTSKDGPCPSGVIGAYGNFPNDSEVNCASSSTTVRANAVLQRGDPEHPDLLSRLRPDLESIDIRSQDVPTVRLTTHCDPADRTFVLYCGTTGFWRDNAQFPANIGLDLMQLRYHDLLGYEHGDPWWQDVEAGTGSEEECCDHYPGPARYRLLSPNGAVLMSGSPAVASEDSVLKRIGFNLRMRAGARRLFLVGSGFAGRPVVADVMLVFELTRLSRTR